MNAIRHRSAWFLAGTVLALLSGHPVLADDTELFFGATGATADAAPNVLFIIDTSGSMVGNVTTQVPFDPNVAWPGSCATNRIYWRSGTGSPPGCGTSQWFDLAAQRCDAASNALPGTGFYTDNVAQYQGGRKRWNQLRANQKGNLVECRADRGVHGDGVDPNSVWAADGNSGPWSTDSSDEVSWTGRRTGRTYTLYSGNWLNWFHNASTVTQTRLEIVQQVTNNLIDSISGVNIGLMRFSNNHHSDPFETRAEGGMIIHAMEDINTSRATVQSKINALDHDGWTPPAESLYEAAQYFRGDQVDYGVKSRGNTMNLEPSVPESRSLLDPTYYRSPIEYSCQKNFVVLLTDGAPTTDMNADSKIVGLPKFGQLVGSSCDGSGHGACLDDLAEWMFEADLSPLDGVQNVTTYTVGFTVDLPILANTARRGGGEYYLADDTSSLTVALTNIVSEILQTTTTFVSPTVSVNAFNRTQNLNDLFITVFRPESEFHWPGNVKKYEVQGNKIVGADGLDAVDPNTGFFKDNAMSFWPDATDPIDGSDVERGGAANQLPNPVPRKLYTYLGNLDLTAGSNLVDTGNALITDAMLGGGNVGDPSRDNLIDFARGLDVTDRDGDGVTLEARLSMGDPLHAKPVTVIYGGTEASPDLNDSVIFAATNEGFVHAVDPATGVELWAFAPAGELEMTRDFLLNEPTSAKTYGLDGSLVVHKHDVDDDGIVEPGDGDRVYVYFGQRRGGDAYFALDVTAKDSPRFMWSADAATPGIGLIGQSWSTPSIVKVNVNGTVKLAMIVGSGYDTRHDNGPHVTGDLGAGVVMLDALTGTVLWRAGSDGGADLTRAEMVNSMVSEVRVLDVNNDDLSDRMYIGDLGGRVWRFDIHNGQPRGSLVTGGVLARLGKGNTAGGPEDNRRFYAAPDVALVPTDTSGYLNIAIGSGYRAHPLAVDVEDNFFALRDPNVFNQLTQAEYDALTPIEFVDLVDITNNTAPILPLDAKGWRLELRDPNFIGEKVLAESVTFLDTVFFTSFTPVANKNPCAPGTGVNKLYMVNIRDGSPVNNLDEVGDEYTLTEDDRSTELAQGGIAPEPVFLFPDQANCTGDCPEVLGLVGVEAFSPGAFPPFVRTFWLSQDAEL